MDRAPWRWNHRTELEDTLLEEQTEKVLMKAREVLHKLMYQNSDSLSEGLLKLDMDDHNARIAHVAEIVVAKAISDARAVSACAEMVRDVCKKAEGETAKKFRKEVLDRCQKGFQEMTINKDKIRKNGKEIDEASSKYEKEAMKLDLEDFSQEMRERHVGNVRFIGELFKLGVLTMRIIVDCIETLLGNHDEESYDCLCTLLTTAGEKLESSLKDFQRRAGIPKRLGGPRPKFIPGDFMDKTFKKLAAQANDQTLSSRIQVSLLALVELRDRRWSQLQQQQQNRFGRFSSSPGPGSGSGVRSTGSFSSTGMNVTPGGGAEKCNWIAASPAASTSGFAELPTRFILTKDPNAWRPNRLRWSRRKETTEDSPEEKQTEAVVKQARGILNKLTQNNFDKLAEIFLKLNLNEQQDRISAVINVVFGKAVNEPSYSAAYAQILHNVCQQSQEMAKKFRKEILDQCQREFQKTNTDEDEIAKKKKEIVEAPADKKEPLKLDLEEFQSHHRRRSLGKVRFIGELFNLQMLTPKIVVDCVQMLVGNQDEDSYECLCTLLTIMGQKLDDSLKDVENRAREAKARGGPKPKFIPEDNYMDKTFKRLKALSSDPKLTSRIRFTLLDLVEFRDRMWFPRSDSNAQKIDEVRRGINQSHLGVQRRQSRRSGNQSTRQKKGERNTVPGAKSSRFSQVEKSSEVSNSPVIAPSGVSWREPVPFNRPSSNSSNLPPRLAQQQRLQQQQQQQNRFARSSVASSCGPGSGNRFNSLLTESSSYSSGINVMPGGGGMSTGGSSAHLIQSSQQHQRLRPPPTSNQPPMTSAAPGVSPADLPDDENIT